MRDLYEVLGVEVTADEAAIVKAYRKAALQWHPDKNQHRIEEASERFKEIQNAYEVLNDKHERAWYDSHKAQILRSQQRYQAGGDAAPGGQRPDDLPDLFPFFSASCYSGFGDGPKGFYGVYERVFSQLADLEARAAAEARQDYERPPAFGTADSSWAEVSAFYAHWTNFASVQDFSWADQYNPASAPNRKVRRLMEEDNRKRRKAERREFCDTVRELAAFVRKRDKRVAVFQAAEAQRRLAAEKAAAERREAERQARIRAARDMQEAEWLRRGEDDTSSSQEGSSSEEEDEEALAVQALRCLACDKLFKSERAFANHERSKLHRERVAALREVLLREEGGAGEPDHDAQAGDGASGADEARASDEEAATSSVPQPAGDDRPRKGKKKKKGRLNAATQEAAGGEGSSNGNDHQAAGEEGWAPPSNTQKAASKKARRRQQRAQQAAAADSGSSEDEDAEHSAAPSSRPAQSTGARAPAAAQEAASSSASGEEADEEALLQRMAQAGRRRHNGGATRGGGSSQEGPSEAEASEEEEAEEDEDALLQRLLRSQRPGGAPRADPAQSSSAEGSGSETGERSSADTPLPGRSEAGGATGPADSETEARAAADRPQPRSVPAADELAQQLGSASLSAKSTGAPAGKAGQAAQGKASPARPAQLNKRDKKKLRQQGKGGQAAALAGAVAAAADQAVSATQCAVCGLEMGTRNKLFKHIAATGHAALKA